MSLSSLEKKACYVEISATALCGINGKLSILAILHLGDDHVGPGGYYEYYEHVFLPGLCVFLGWYPQIHAKRCWLGWSKSELQDQGRE